MHVQTTNNSEHKLSEATTANAPSIEYYIMDQQQQQTENIYPTVPDYLVSNSGDSMLQQYHLQQQQQHYQQQQPQQGYPMYIPPQQQQQYTLPPARSSQYSEMIPNIHNSGFVYITSPNQQVMMNHPPQPQQQRQPQQHQYPTQYTINNNTTQPPQQQPTTTPLPEEEKPYFVHQLNRHTDTLLRLALRYHCTEEDIKMLNSLLCDDLDLFEGRTLLIPKCDPSLIKKNYDLEETKHQTERQRHLMVTTFSKNNNITIDEAKVYLETNDWNGKKAQEELIQDQAWEKQTTGTVKTPSDFKQQTAGKTYTTTTSKHGTMTHRSSRNDGKYPQYGFEMMTYER